MNLRSNVSEIKRLMRERKEVTDAMIRFLTSKGIALAIIEEILSELAGEGKELSSIQEAIASRLHVTGELSFTEPHELAFVGPTGVGKTTIIMKLAEHYQQLQRRVAVLSLDDSKSAALYAWAVSKGIGCIELEEKTDAEVVLIDTEGCNFYLPHRVDALGEKLYSRGKHMEVILTMSVASKEVDLYGAVHQFSPLCPSSLAFTKLDETLAAGVLVNVSAKCDIPLRYVGHGYPLPGAVQIAEPKSIIHKILTDFNKEEFQLLRQL